MGSYIGIDLGTTFSAVACLDDAGMAKIIKNKGQNITPSCVMIKESTDAESGEVSRSVIVGEQARRVLQFNDNSAGRFKRHMGTDHVYNLCGQPFTPTQLSGAVLSALKEVAEDEIGEIAEAVITVPANFGQEARTATLEAAKIAGLNVKHVINEPTAALLHYSQLDSTGDGIFAVYDLGGGTFDVTIAKVQGTEVEVLSTVGVHKLGGWDFDKALVALVNEKYKEATGSELADEKDYPDMDAEKDKMALTDSKRVVAGAGNGVADEMLHVTRAEFEEAISSLVAQTEMCCEQALSEAKVELSDIKAVFLAGGSTRVPCVEACVEKAFKQKPIASVNVDEVVALGAVLYAAVKGEGGVLNTHQKSTVEKMSVEERTSNNFGTLVWDGSEHGGLENSIIIPRNEKIPCEIKKSYYTMSAGQTGVMCRVTECSTPETDPRFVKTVWQGELELPPGRPEGQEIEVTYGYDGNQVMKCSFVDVESGREENVDLNMNRGDDDDDNSIEEMLDIE